MPSRARFIKLKTYPRPHDKQLSWAFNIETTGKYATTVPIAHYDEGLGAPDTYNSNPLHASFAVSDASNCFVDSRIDNMFVQVTFALTKGAVETDKIVAMRCGFMPQYLAFKEDYEASDEATTAEIQDALLLTKETTDRQGYPLFSTVKLTEKFAGSATYNATQPGLTTTQVIESVNNGLSVYYDMLQYMNVSGKLKNVQGGMKWFTLTKQKPVHKVLIKLRSKAKRMNPYTFFGVFLMAAPVGTHLQIPAAGDVTEIDHVWMDCTIRYLEWHQNFDHEIV